jgi:hypothetical protein
MLVLVVNHEGRRENNIKADLRGKDVEGVDWIRLVYESKKCRTVVNTILNILVIWNGILLAKAVLGLQESLCTMELGSYLKSKSLCSCENDVM